MQAFHSPDKLQIYAERSRITNPDSLKKIKERLPFEMKRKWRGSVDDISENKQREITIEDVEKRARCVHPIFGDILPPKHYKGKLRKFANSPLRAPRRTAAFGISEDSKDSQTSRNSPQ